MRIDPAISWTLALSVTLLFGAAALHKLWDWARFRDVVHNYQLVPQALVPVVAALAIMFELGAAFLMVGVSTRPMGGTVAAGLLVAYAMAMAINLARGRTNLDCGCLGVGKRQAIRWWMVGRNLVIAALALLGSEAMSARELTGLDVFTILCATVSLALLYTAHGVLGAVLQPRSNA
jgi:hypothetical protein